MIDPVLLLKQKPLYESVKSATQIAKYVLGAFTTALSIFSLVRKTTVDPQEADAPKKLTAAGRRYLIGIIALTTATVIVAAADDWADSRLSEIFKVTFDAALTVKNQELIEHLSPQFVDLGKQVKQTTNELKTFNESTAIVSHQILRRGIETSDKLSAVQLNTIESMNKNSRAFAHTQENLEQANIPISSLTITLRIYKAGEHRHMPPSTPQPVIVGFDEKFKQVQEQLDVCTNIAEAYEIKRKDCTNIEENHERWLTTRFVARKLNPEGDASVTLAIKLRSFSVTVRDVDCSAALHVKGPEPCLRASASSTTITSDTDMSMMNAPEYPAGIAVMMNAQPLYRFEVGNFPDKTTNHQFYGRDIDIQDVLISVCPSNRAGLDINPLKSIELPFSSNSIISIDELAEIAPPAGDRTTNNHDFMIREYDYRADISTLKKALRGCFYAQLNPV